MRNQMIKATPFTASWNIFPLQVWADKQVSSCIFKLSSLTEIPQESCCNRFLFSPKLNKQISGVPTYYILFHVQSKRNAMLGKQNRTFLSFPHIWQHINKTSRHKAVKLKVLTALDVVIKESRDESEMLGKKWINKNFALLSIFPIGMCEIWSELVKSLFFLYPHCVSSLCRDFMSDKSLLALQVSWIAHYFIDD